MGKYRDSENIFDCPESEDSENAFSIASILNGYYG